MDEGKARGLIEWINVLKLEPPIHRLKELSDGRLLLKIQFAIQNGDFEDGDLPQDRFSIIQEYLEVIYLINFKRLINLELIIHNRDEKEIGKVALLLLNAAVVTKNNIDKIIRPVFELDHDLQEEVKVLIDYINTSYIPEQPLHLDFNILSLRRSEDGMDPADSHEAFHSPHTEVFCNSPQSTGRGSTGSLKEYMSPLLSGSASNSPIPFQSLSIHSPQILKTILAKEKDTKRKNERVMRQKDMELRRMTKELHSEKNLREDIELDLNAKLSAIESKDLRIKELEQQNKLINHLREENEVLQCGVEEKTSLQQEVDRLRSKLEEMRSIKEANKSLEDANQQMIEEIHQLNKQMEILSRWKEKCEACQKNATVLQERVEDAEKTISQQEENIKRLGESHSAVEARLAHAQELYKIQKDQYEELLLSPAGNTLDSGENMGVVKDKLMDELNSELDLLREELKTTKGKLRGSEEMAVELRNALHTDHQRCEELGLQNEKLTKALSEKDGEVKSLERRLAEEHEQYLVTLKQESDQSKQHHEAVMEKIKSDHMLDMSKNTAAFEETLQQLRETHQSEIQRSELKVETLQGIVNTLTGQQTSLEVMVASKLQEVQDLNEEAVVFKNTISSLESRLEEQRQKNEESVMNAEENFAQKVESYEAKIREIIFSKEQEMVAQKKEFDAEISNLIQTLTEEKELKCTLLSEACEMKCHLLQQNLDQLEVTNKALTEQYALEYKTLEEKHECKLNSLIMEYEAKCKNLNEEHETKFQKLKDEDDNLRKLVEETEDLHRNLVENLELKYSDLGVEHEVKCKKLIEGHEAEIKNILLECSKSREESELKCKKVVMEHEAMHKKLVEEHALECRNLGEEYKAKCKNLEEKLIIAGREMEEVTLNLESERRLHVEDQEKLVLEKHLTESHVSDLQAEVKKLVDEKTILSSRLQQIIEEKERSVNANEEYKEKLSDLKCTSEQQEYSLIQRYEEALACEKKSHESKMVAKAEDHTLQIQEILQQHAELQISQASEHKAAIKQFEERLLSLQTENDDKLCEKDLEIAQLSEMKNQEICQLKKKCEMTEQRLQTVTATLTAKSNELEESFLRLERLAFEKESVIQQSEKNLKEMKTESEQLLNEYQIQLSANQELKEQAKTYLETLRSNEQEYLSRLASVKEHNDKLLAEKEEKHLESWKVRQQEYEQKLSEMDVRLLTDLAREKELQTNLFGEVTMWKKKVASLEEEIEQMKVKEAETQEGHNKCIQIMDQELQAKNASIIQEFQEESEALKQALAETERLEADHRSTIETLKAELKGKTFRCTELQSEIEDKTRDREHYFTAQKEQYQQEIADMKKELGDLHSSISQLQMINDSQMEELEEKNEEVNNMKQTMEDTKKEFSTLNAKYIQLESEMEGRIRDQEQFCISQKEQYQKEVADMKEEQGKLCNSINELQMINDSQTEELREKNQEVNKMKEMMEDTEKELSSLNAKYIQQKRNYQKKFEEQTGEFSEKIDSFVQTYEMRLNDANSQIALYKNKLMTSQEEVSEAQKALKQKEEMMVDLNKKIENLSTNHIALKNEVLESAEKKAAETEAWWQSKLESQSAEFKLQMEEVEKTAEKSRQELTYLRQAQIEKEKKFAESERSQTDKEKLMQDQVKLLEDKLNFSEKDLKLRKEHQEKLKSLIEKKTERCEKMEGILQAKVHELEMERAQTTTLTKKLEKLNSEFIPLQKQLQEKEHSNKKLDHQVQSLEVQLSHSERLLKKYKAELENAGTELLGNTRPFLLAQPIPSTSSEDSILDDSLEAHNNTNYSPHPNRPRPTTPYFLRSRHSSSSDVPQASVVDKLGKMTSLGNITHNGSTPQGKTGSLMFSSHTDVKRTSKSLQSLNSSMISTVSTESTRSANVPRGAGSLFACEDEEDMEYTWDRLGELQRRNTLCRPHLKTCYPVETQTVDSTGAVANEKSIRGAHFESSKSYPHLSNRKRRTDSSEEQSHRSNNRKSARHSTTVLTEGPAGNTRQRRLSGDKMTPNRSTRRRSKSAGTPVASRENIENELSMPVQDPRRESIAFNIENTPKALRRVLKRQTGFVRNKEENRNNSVCKLINMFESSSSLNQSMSSTGSISSIVNVGRPVSGLKGRSMNVSVPNSLTNKTVRSVLQPKKHTSILNTTSDPPGSFSGFQSETIPSASQSRHQTDTPSNISQTLPLTAKSLEESRTVHLRAKSTGVAQAVPLTAKSPEELQAVHLRAKSTEVAQAVPLTAKSPEVAQAVPLTAKSPEELRAVHLRAKSLEVAQAVPLTAKSPEVAQAVPLTAKSPEVAQAVPLTAKSPEVAQALPLTAKSPEVAQAVPLTAKSPEVAQAVPLTAKSPEVAQAVPLTAKSPELAQAVPLTAKSPEVAQAVPLTAKSPEVPQAVHLTAKSPEVPQAVPLTAKFPEVPQAVPLTAKSPEVPQAVPLTAKFPEVPQAVPLTAKSPEELRAVSLTAKSPEVPQAVPVTAKFPEVAQAVPLTAKFPEVAQAVPCIEKSLSQSVANRSLAANSIWQSSPTVVVNITHQSTPCTLTFRNTTTPLHRKLFANEKPAWDMTLSEMNIDVNNNSDTELSREADRPVGLLPQNQVDSQEAPSARVNPPKTFLQRLTPKRKESKKAEHTPVKRHFSPKTIFKRFTPRRKNIKINKNVPLPMRLKSALSDISKLHSSDLVENAEDDKQKQRVDEPSVPTVCDAEPVQHSDALGDTCESKDQIGPTSMNKQGNKGKFARKKVEEETNNRIKHAVPDKFKTNSKPSKSNMTRNNKNTSPVELTTSNHRPNEVRSPGQLTTSNHRPNEVRSPGQLTTSNHRPNEVRSPGQLTTSNHRPNEVRSPGQLTTSNHRPNVVRSPGQLTTSNHRPNVVRSPGHLTTSNHRPNEVRSAGHLTTSNHHPDVVRSPGQLTSSTKHSSEKIISGIRQGVKNKTSVLEKFIRKLSQEHKSKNKSTENIKPGNKKVQNHLTVNSRQFGTGKLTNNSERINRENATQAFFNSLLSQSEVSQPVATPPAKTAKFSIARQYFADRIANANETDF